MTVDNMNSVHLVRIESEIQCSSDGLIKRFVSSWYDRATVRRSGKLMEALDADTPDFLNSLLPFRDDPAFRSGSAETRSACLSAGWIIYNAKTIAIETEVIVPTCLDLLKSSLSQPLSFPMVSAVAETVTDEGFHTLIASELCDMTASFRGIELKLPEFELTRRLSVHKENLEEKLFSLVRLAYATVSEVFISDYLSLLSSAKTIQPLFRSAVALHKADEDCHKRLFPRLVHAVINDCSQEQRQLFINSVYDAVTAFSSRETRVWSDALAQIYAGREDCKGLDLPICTELTGGADFTGVAELLADLNLIDQTCTERSCGKAM